ncbi:hypothetical protein FPV67DRAFT_414999 [Lyophyllum atratum]|nr:hypothetical protein FPV67DRAFT_414999 [Lyophyllum atratum]
MVLFCMLSSLIHRAGAGTIHSRDGDEDQRYRTCVPRHLRLAAFERMRTSPEFALLLGTDEVLLGGMIYERLHSRLCKMFSLPRITIGIVMWVGIMTCPKRAKSTLRGLDTS